MAEQIELIQEETVMEETHTKAAIYCRVATKQQAKGASLEVQEETCREYANEHAIEVVRVFREVYSASFLDERPDLTTMRDLYGNGEINYVIVEAWDRLSDNILHLDLLLHEMWAHDVEFIGVYEEKHGDAAEYYHRRMADLLGEYNDHRRPFQTGKIA